MMVWIIFVTLTISSLMNYSKITIESAVFDQCVLFSDFQYEPKCC